MQITIVVFQPKHKASHAIWLFDIVRIFSPLKHHHQIEKLGQMTKCPRCNIEQQESSQCEYCGLVFEAFGESPQASRVARSKWMVRITLILVLTGALLAAYVFIIYPGNPSEKSKGVERSAGLAQKSKEKDLGKTLKELSGDVGILGDFTGGHTKAGIIAMVIFSVIGLGYFTYGKKSRQLLMLICGIALMGYSYFVDGIAYIVLIGAGLCALPFILGRN